MARGGGVEIGGMKYFGELREAATFLNDYMGDWGGAQNYFELFYQWHDCTMGGEHEHISCIRGWVAKYFQVGF